MSTTMKKLLSFAKFCTIFFRQEPSLLGKAVLNYTIILKYFTVLNMKIYYNMSLSKLFLSNVFTFIQDIQKSFHNSFFFVAPWCSGYRYSITSFNKASAQVLHSFKSCLRMSVICDIENLWQWFRLEIRLNAFHRSTIPQNNSPSSSLTAS